VVVFVPVSVWTRREQHLQPARTRQDALSLVPAAPALDEAHQHAVELSRRPLDVRRLPTYVVDAWPSSRPAVDAGGLGREQLDDRGCGGRQREDGELAVIVQPRRAGRPVDAQRHAATDLTQRPLRY